MYIYQTVVYGRKGNPQKSGSLSFAVIFGMLAFAWTQQFDGTAFVFVLLPAIGLLVAVSQFRDTDFPRLASVILLLLHLLQLVLGIYFLVNE